MRMKINFKNFPVYKGISKSTREAVDISESLANCIYSSVPGIKAHVLAEKIFKAEQGIELDEEEVAINITSQLPGMYADSITDHIKELEVQP